MPSASLHVRRQAHLKKVSHSNLECETFLLELTGNAPYSYYKHKTVSSSKIS